MVIKNGLKVSGNELAKDRRFKGVIPKDKVHGLLAGRSEELDSSQAAILEREAKSFCVLPYSSHGDILLERVRRALGEGGQAIPSDVQQYAFQAVQIWLPFAMIPSADVADRALMCLAAGYVILNISDPDKHFLRKDVDKALLKQIDSKAVIDPLDSAYRDLIKLLEETKANLPASASNALRAGFRTILYRLRNDRMGLNLRRSGNLAKVMEEAASSGFVEEAKWVAAITNYRFLSAVKNPWQVLFCASRWAESTQFARTALTQSEELRRHILEPAGGQRAIINDKDAWPGLAALLVHSSANPPKGMNFQAILDHQGFREAFKIMEPMILAGSSYSAVRTSMEKTNA